MGCSSGKQVLVDEDSKTEEPKVASFPKNENIQEHSTKKSHKKSHSVVKTAAGSDEENDDEVEGSDSSVSAAKKAHHDHQSHEAHTAHKQKAQRHHSHHHINVEGESVDNTYSKTAVTAHHYGDHLITGDKSDTSFSTQDHSAASAAERAIRDAQHHVVHKH